MHREFFSMFVYKHFLLNKHFLKTETGTETKLIKTKPNWSTIFKTNSFYECK